MLGMTSFYNSDEHTIIDGELSRYCNKLLEGDSRRCGNIFVVRYNKLGNFVIAEWLTPHRDMFVDVMNLSKSLANFTREKANELRHRFFAPVTADETSKEIARADSDYHHEMQNWNDEEEERLQKCARGE